MKTIFLIVFLVVWSSFSTKANNMLFPQYEEGVAILRGGARAMTQFNYDMTEQRMLFIDRDGRSLVLDPNNVVLVTIGERSFVPAGNNDAFNERVAVGDNHFYVRHRVKKKQSGGVYGTPLHTRVVTDWTQADGSIQHSIVDDSRAFQGLRVSAIDESTIFIRRGNRFVEVNSLRSLSRQFRAYRGQIRDFARRNNTNFRNIEDMRTIVAYALSL